MLTGEGASNDVRGDGGNGIAIGICDESDSADKDLIGVARKHNTITVTASPDKLNRCNTPMIWG